MGADQVAAIRPALQELMDGFQRNETGASDLCATFSVPSHPDAWVQVAAGIVNFSYPRSEEPLGLLRSADVPKLPGLTLQTFAPLAYVTLSHEPCPAGQLARFIDRVLSLVHELPPDDYPIDVEFESLA
jgi:hypothetical protein